MKRFVLFFLALGLLLSLSGLCLAAEAPLSVSDSEGGAGQTVYLTVTLEESVMANTIGVQCEFDKTLLTALPELCTWGNTGLLSAFDTDNIGVWAGADSVDLQGKLCVLAFQVQEGVTFSQTKVKCTVILKDDARELGTYTAEGSITCKCVHEYGDWTSGGSLGHVRVCSLCGGKNTQSHDWDDGTQKPGEGNMTIVTYTCLVCRDQTTVEVPTGGEAQKPTEPGQTEPDGIVVRPTVPDQDSYVPTYPTQTGQQDQSQSTQTGANTGIQTEGVVDHTHAAGEETLSSDLGNTDGQTSAEADHDHSTTAGGTDPANIWVIVGVLAVAITGAVLFLKKKR